MFLDTGGGPEIRSMLVKAVLFHELPWRLINPEISSGVQYCTRAASQRMLGTLFKYSKWLTRSIVH